MHVRSIATLLLLAGPLFAAPAAAQSVLVEGVQPTGFAEAAVASCAGGAMIGYLVVLAAGTPLGTAALFCGLSVVATAASGIAVWTWDTATSFTR